MRWTGIAAWGVGLGAVWVLVACSGELSHGGVPRFAVLYFAAAALYLGALGAVGRAVRRGAATPPPSVLAGLLLLGLGARVALLPSEPSLSDDVWRYLWEGRVQLAGYVPYAIAPDDPALAELRDGVWLRVNNRHVPAIYGPPLEGLFAGLALVSSRSVLPFKLAFLVADAAIVVLLVRLLRRRGRSPLWALAYAWHPLVVLEGAGQAHVELVPVALLVGAVDLEEAGRRRAAALALGAAIAAKYLPLLILPAFLLRRAGWRARLGGLGWVLLPGVVTGLPYLVAAAAGPGAALSAYAGTFRFNDGGFFALDALLRGAGLSQAFCRSVLPALPGIEVPPGFDPADHQTWMLVPPKLATGALLLGVVAWTVRPSVRADPARLAVTAGAAFLLLSPTVHPWYALWVVPFLPCWGASPARGPAEPGRAGLLCLSLALPVSYEVLLGYDGSAASWRPAPWVRWVEHAPAGALLLAGAVLRWPARDVDVGDSEPARGRARPEGSS